MRMRASSLAGHERSFLRMKRPRATACSTRTACYRFVSGRIFKGSTSCTARNSRRLGAAAEYQPHLCGAHADCLPDRGRNAAMLTGAAAPRRPAGRRLTERRAQVRRSATSRLAGATRIADPVEVRR